MHERWAFNIEDFSIFFRQIQYITENEMMERVHVVCYITRYNTSKCQGDVWAARRKTKKEKEIKCPCINHVFIFIITCW